MDVEIVSRDEKLRSTKKSDVYSLSMVVVAVRLVPESMPRPGSYYLHFQLVTGRMPFPELTDVNVEVPISKRNRPPKPHHFDAPGITPAVWKIAEKCWHEKANERPEVNVVLKHLENLANPGVCTHEPEGCSYYN
jgi:hypothetical protein